MILRLSIEVRYPEKNGNSQNTQFDQRIWNTRDINSRYIYTYIYRRIGYLGTGCNI